MSINRFNLHRVFLAVSLALSLVGFSDLLGAQISGLGRAFGAIAFILFLIFNYLKNEKTDEELREARRPETSRESADRPVSRGLRHANA